MKPIEKTKKESRRHRLSERNRQAWNGDLKRVLQLLTSVLILRWHQRLLERFSKTSRGSFTPRFARDGKKTAVFSKKIKNNVNTTCLLQQQTTKKAARQSYYPADGHSSALCSLRAKNFPVGVLVILFFLTCVIIGLEFVTAQAGGQA